MLGTRAVLGAVTGAPFTIDNYLNINGLGFSNIDPEPNDSSGVLVDAINADTPQTGVTAFINGDSLLELYAADGSNILVEEVGEIFDLVPDSNAANETVIFKRWSTLNLRSRHRDW